MDVDAKAFRPWYVEPATQLVASLSAGVLHHALLISGAKGSGSVLFAAQLAKILLCENVSAGVVSTMGCGQCKSCALTAADTHPDLIILTPLEDKTTISIQAVRAAKDQLLQTAQIAKNKVCLISPADALTENASNALLKLLEEPPENCYFLMPTNAAYLLLPTIKSRCMSVALIAPSREQLHDVLATKFAPADVDRAIEVHRGFPEPVLEALQEGHAEIAFEQTIADFACGRATAIALAGKIEKQQLPAFLDALYQFLVTTLAHKRSGSTSKQSASPFTLFSEPALLAMIQRTILARRDLRHNPAFVLHIEALLIELQRIGRETG